jgi:hemerythrin superfamily protein
VNSDEEEEALLQALLAHNRKEENILYPAIDRLTSEEEKAAAFQAMADLPEGAYRTCCGGKHNAAAHR